MLNLMRITAGENDAPEFIAKVNDVIEGLLKDIAPASLIAIQIDNWFGRMWLGFAGIFGVGSPESGIIGVSDWNRELRVPPFVLNRVVSQRSFAGPTFEESDPGEPIHKAVPSKLARRRKLSDVVPGAIVIWYSGSSRETGRGSLMVYPPDAHLENAWYADWTIKGMWRVTDNGGYRHPEKLKNVEVSF
jgi:hypothetical protein